MLPGITPIGLGVGHDIPDQDNDVIEARDHERSPRVSLSAPTFSTPIRFAAMSNTGIASHRRLPLSSLGNPEQPLAVGSADGPLNGLKSGHMAISSDLRSVFVRIISANDPA